MNAIEYIQIQYQKNQPEITALISSKKLLNSALLMSILDGFFETIIEPVADKIVFDADGHHKEWHGKTFREIAGDDSVFNPFSYKRVKRYLSVHMLMLIESIHQKDKNLICYNFDKHCFKLEEIQCSDCGVTVRLVLDFKAMTISQSEFMKKHGHASDCPIALEDDLVARTTINVPSGKLVFANTLHTLFPDDYKKTSKAVPYGTQGIVSERLRMSAFSEQQNMIICSTGNSCPTVFLKDGEVLIVDEYDFLVDRFGDEDWELHSAKDFFDKELGKICTDAWMFNAIDSEAFTALVAKDPDALDFSYFEVNVEPGIYEVTGNYYIADFKGIYSSIKRIGDIK